MASVPSIVLGVSHNHGDSSAALIVDGKLVAAAEEERFTRVKHYALFPSRAIQYCLQEAGLQASDVELVAVARRPRSELGRRIKLLWSHPQLWSARRGGG